MASFAVPPPSSTITTSPTTTTRISPATTLNTRIRLANPKDVPHIHKLIYQLAVYQNDAHLFTATESSLTATLFSAPPFQSATALLLEVSPNPFQIQTFLSSSPPFTPIEKTLHLDQPIKDPEAETFKSTSGNNSVVTGFVLIAPGYSSFEGKMGIHVEDLLVRKSYRRKGFGKMLLAAVAEHAEKTGCARVDWSVLDWNESAIKFYEGMGAKILGDWRICRLDVEALKAYAPKK